jgi:4-alpha-glucanotransferase
MERSSGVLLHISSLPSPYGIGTLGQAAYDFADFLHASGQQYWQILPLGPTGFGDSPYQSLSSFAGNPYFIDLEELAKEELLTQEELQSIDWGKDPGHVDYGQIYLTRFDLLKKAYTRGWNRDLEKITAFRSSKKWLEDYALYMALKAHFEMKGWADWPDQEIRLRKPEAMAKYRSLLTETIQFHIYLQYLFYTQWNKLRTYVHSLGIKIIGDLPIYISMDSADIWAEPEFFKLDENLRLKEVAGVPPDDFNADGQLWGNPLYDYDRMRADGWGWWIRRVEGASELYDVIRFDHFRGFESYWAVPAGESTAKNGVWKKGPGIDLVGVLTSWFSSLSFIAEDLGYLTPAVRALLSDSGLPGMKILEFAFYSRDPSDYLPHAYPRNCVCYTGTHDNETIAQWLASISPEVLDYARTYLGLNHREGYRWGMLRGCMSSSANLFIAQMQDYLGKGKEGRMNTPGTALGNWQWRLLPGEINETLAKKIRKFTALYGRCAL